MGGAATDLPDESYARRVTARRAITRKIEPNDFLASSGIEFTRARQAVYTIRASRQSVICGEPGAVFLESTMKLSESAKAFFRAQGAKGGKLGGKIAAANMTPEQRSARAKKASLARKPKPK